MAIHNLPRKLRNIAHFAIFAAAISLFAITALAGHHSKIDGATVAAADVMATNGVIHVIDNVILPN